jgi:hypothetical protein
MLVVLGSVGSHPTWELQQVSVSTDAELCEQVGVKRYLSLRMFEEEWALPHGVRR